MLIRRETPKDAEAIRGVHTMAFASPELRGQTPVEARLVDELRASDAWLPELSLVAIGSSDSIGSEGKVAGHVVCTRGRVGRTAALGLGPLGVLPHLQRRGIGQALMHAVLGAADALNEPLVVLLGHASYYPRFGFRPAEEYGITPPVPEWAPNFQARALAAYDPSIRGEFAFAKPFADL
jgi:putative acetyltransferase